MLLEYILSCFFPLYEDFAVKGGEGDWFNLHI